jgi:fructuronate reductase
MARLSNSTVSKATAFCPTYDRDALGIGIVHLGPGAFHRAHQAVFTDGAIAKSGGNWGICAVSLNSTHVKEALSPQDGLYTLAIKDKNPSYRIIGSIKEVLCAREDSATVLARLSHADTHFVTLTITEKGYALTQDGHLDKENRFVAEDLETPHIPVSAIGYLVEAFRQRREAGVGSLTVISCDNLPSNGDKLKRVCIEFAQTFDAALASHIEDDIRFPNTMVDSITPATDDGVREDVQSATGLKDAWPVQREAFAQWVIEDNLPRHRPDWAGAGATLTNDVHGFEMAKLRILNGAHSTLTYLGLLAGEESVKDAISNEALYDFVNGLIREETLSTIDTPEGLNTSAYWSQIIARFENPKIRHLLEQISHDGSQKIPARIFPVIEYYANHDIVARRACFVVAGWIEFNRQRRLGGKAPTDAYLTSIESQLPSYNLAPADYAKAFTRLETVFPAFIRSDEKLVKLIVNHAVNISDEGVIASARKFKS